MPTPPVVTFLLGAWDLGICADLVLQGVVFAQFAHYVTLYSKDILALRAFVGGLLIITTLKSAQAIAIMWSQNVTHFADIGGAAGPTWTSEANIVFVAFIAFYVQLFFCQRLWASLSAIVSTAYTFAGVTDTRNARWIGIHLGTVFAGDFFLCGSTVYFLLSHSKQVLPETGGMLNAIVKLTFRSAAPAALCACLNLIGSQADPKAASGSPNAWTLLTITSNFVLPKLYALSAMWTLNSRKSIQLAHSNGRNTGSTEVTSGRRGRTNNVTVSLSGNRNVMPIQVKTQVQTMQHTDDIYSPKSPMEDMSENDERSMKN
ncbi:hypothetical protein C8R44DRAFT_873511 [Mycena epipterygia]|nr:hypothetical protein C8R44DRAFT_873511 [Mycena epipterygia]